MLSQLILAVSCAIFISALCSVFEAILYSLPISYLEILKKTNPEGAKKLKQLKDNVDQPITAILTLNTIAHTIGAAVAGAAAAGVFGKQNLVWFSIVFTLAILIFSEILPKTAGIKYSKQLAPYIATPLKWMVILLRPFIILCQAVTQIIPHKGNPNQISAEELQAIAILSRKSGQIEKEQEKVITNILQLGEKTVRQVMTPRTVTFSLDKTLNVAEAAKLKDKWRIHSRVPIYDDHIDNVVGIVLSRDVYMAAADDKHTLKLYQIMRPVHFVPETASLNSVFIEFFERHQHLFMVVDEYGSVTGVITMEDIIEEIVGREIIDESDKIKNMRELARIRKRSVEETQVKS